MSDSGLETTEQQPQLLDHLLTIGQAVQRDIIQNPKQVYQLIVETTCRLSEADCAVLYPYHPSFGEFYDLDNVATYGLRYESQLEKRVDKVKGLAARVHREGEIIRQDIEREDLQISQTSPFINREGIKAFMGLSLKFGAEIVGLLYVDYREPHRFSEEEKRLIRLLGQQAALAVSNSWAYQLADIRAEAVAKLKTIGQTLTTIKDPSVALESILEGIAHSAQEVLDADLVDLYQYIQSHQKFILPPMLVGERRYPHVLKTAIYADDVVVNAVGAGAPQYFADVPGTPALTGEYKIERNHIPDQRFVRREGIVSSATIPLVAADETVGVMFVNYRAPQLFDSEQRDLIESFAAQAAVAIHNARLFQLEQTQRRQSDTLRRVAQLVNSTLERDEVIGLVLEQLGQVIEYSSASVQLIQGDRRFLVGGRGFLLADSPAQLQHDVSQDALVSKIVRERYPVVLSDVKDEPLWDHIPQTVHIRSWIGVPLIVRDQVIGLLTVDHDTPGYYTQESGEVVAAFANQVATAIYNAELFALEQRRNQEFQTLHRAANKLVEQPALPEIYQTAVQATLEALQCRHSTIFILDKQTGELVATDRAGKLPDTPEIKRFKLGEGLTGQVAETGRSIMVNNTAGDERFIKAGLVSRSMLRSIVLAPIRIKEQLVGVLSADKEEVNGFTSHDMEILETLALDVGIAINLRRQMQQVENQAQTLAELNKLAQQLVSIEEIPPDTRKLLKQIAQSARQVLQADLIELYEYRQDRQEYRLPPVSAGERRESSVPKDKIYEDDAVFQLIHRDAPLYAANVRVDPILTAPYTIKRPGHLAERFVIREGVQSTAAIPLRTGGEVVGLMFASYRLPQTFPAAQKELIELFANQAAIAIRNSRLFHHVNHQLEALTTLTEVGQTLTSGIHLPEDKILDLIYRQLGHLAHTQNVNIALYDEKTNTLTFKLVMERGRRVDIEQEKRFTSRRINKAKVGKTEEIILTGQPILHKTRAETAGWYQEPSHRDSTTEDIFASHLAVPMMLDRQVKGVITLYDWEREYAYDEQDKQVLSVIAGQAAIALENANLYARRIQDINALKEVGQTLTSGLRLKEDEILELIYEQTRKLAAFQEMYIALYDEETQTIKFWRMIEAGQQVTIEPRQADMERRGKTEEVILTRQPLLHRTEQESRGWYDLPGHQEFIGHIQTSYLGVPMMVGEKVLGMIAVYDWEREYAYDELHLQVLSSMASQAAIALENAYLFYDVNQKLERQVQALSALNEVGQTLTAGLRLKEQEILEVIYEQTQYLTETQDMYIALYDEPTQTIHFGLATKEGQRVEIKSRQADMERRGKTEEVILTRQPLLHKTRAESEGWYKLPGRQEFIGAVSPSWLGVPMMLGEKVLGVIAVFDWEREHAYDELHLQVLSAMASQSAIALENARLFELTDRIATERKQRLDRLQQISARMAEAGQNPDEVLVLVAQAATDVSHSDLTGIYLYEQGAARFTRGVRALGEDRIDPVKEADLPDPEGLAAEIATTQAAVFVADAATSPPEYSSFARKRQIQAFAGLPLLIKGGQDKWATAGVLFVNFKQPHHFSDDEQEILRHLANQAAVAIAYADIQAAAVAKEQLTALGTATAAIQHRINNTLNIIGPNVDRLHKRVNTSNETVQEIFDIIKRNIKYTSDYIKRIQEPLKETEQQLIDLNASLREAQDRVWGQYQGEVGFGIVKVAYNLDESLPLLEASSGQITEVFRNLIENSFEAMGAAGGVITISSRRTDGWFEIEIQDSGPGIPPNMRDKLFTKPVPSKQPGQSGQGSGLGLWLSALLVQKYAGEINVAETGPSGTTILVRLPIQKSY